MKVSGQVKIHETLANFISCDPEMFATPKVFNPLLDQLKNYAEESSTLKCLALITGSKNSNQLFEGSDFLTTLISVMLSEKDEASMTYATIAMKNCMLSSEDLGNPSIPWKDIVELMLFNSYSKHNELLQQSSIEALRIMSDKPTVRNLLCKIYKAKVRQIPGLSEESVKLKCDLVQWLSYRNFKSNKLPNYANLFI